MSERNPSQHSAPMEFSEEQVRAAKAGKGKLVFAQALKRAGAKPPKRRDAKGAAIRRNESKKS